MKTKYLSESKNDIEQAGKIIANGGLVAFPTETVYGLGANALDDHAVENVYLAKGRPSDNPMIVHICNINQVEELVEEFPRSGRLLAEAFWPGPLTLIMRARDLVPRRTTGGLDTVGIRFPSSHTAQTLIRLSGCPIAAPSANLSGKPSPTKWEHVAEDLDGKIDAIIKGKDSQVGIESTVVDITGLKPMILRPGIITSEDMEKVLGREVLIDESLVTRPQKKENPQKKRQGLKGASDVVEDECTHIIPRAPGMKYKHYAPKAPVTIFEGDRIKALECLEEREKILKAEGKKVWILDLGLDEVEAASRLFAQLRKADKEGADEILALGLEEKGVGFSVMNRLLKSAGFNTVKC